MHVRERVYAAARLLDCHCAHLLLEIMDYVCHTVATSRTKTAKRRISEPAEGALAASVDGWMDVLLIPFIHLVHTC